MGEPADTIRRKKVFLALFLIPVFMCIHEGLNRE